MRKLLVLLILLSFTLPAFGQVGWISRNSNRSGAGGTGFKWATSNPLLVVDGNSISAGYGLLPGELRYDQLIAQTSPFNAPTIAYYNFAVSGQSTQDMIADGVAQIDSLVVKNPGRPVILVAWELTNDLYWGRNVAQTEANFQTYCNKRKENGISKIVVLTTIPRDATKNDGTSVSQYNSDLDAVNVWLLANYRLFADAVFDVRTIPEFSTLTAMRASGLVPDGIHPNEAGLQKIATGLRTVLLSLEN